jgi:hypothetical protein
MVSLSTDDLQLATSLSESVCLFSDAARSRDGKRKVAEKIGLLKCQISVYRREDEAANGKSKKWGSPLESWPGNDAGDSHGLRVASFGVVTRAERRRESWRAVRGRSLPRSGISALICVVCMLTWSIFVFRYPDRMPKYYHVLQDDLSVEAGLDMERPYNPQSIYENFPEASVEVSQHLAFDCPSAFREVNYALLPPPPLSPIIHVLLPVDDWDL